MVVVVEDVINQIVVLNVEIVFFDVGEQGGVETGFPDVPDAFVARILLTTVTGDGIVPHFVEKLAMVNSALLTFSSYLLLLSVGSLYGISLLSYLLFQLFFSTLLS